MKRTVEDFMKLPYTVEIVPDEESYLAKVKELDGCLTVGDSPAEALEMLEDAKLEWFSAAIADDFDIPLPETMREFKQSGKFALRMPKSLHQKLAEEADIEGVSLNQYLVTLLAERNTLASLKRVFLQGVPNVEKALKRAGKSARELARRTHTPCYVVKDGKIVNVAEQQTDYRPEKKNTGGDGS